MRAGERLLELRVEFEEGFRICRRIAPREGGQPKGGGQAHGTGVAIEGNGNHRGNLDLPRAKAERIDRDRGDEESQEDRQRNQRAVQGS